MIAGKCGHSGNRSTFAALAEQVQAEPVSHGKLFSRRSRWGW
jgi:hypothetical protein